MIGLRPEEIKACYLESAFWLHTYALAVEPDLTAGDIRATALLLVALDVLALVFPGRRWLDRVLGTEDPCRS